MLAFQTYNVYTKWTQENKNFSQTAYITLLNVARRLSALNQNTLPTRDLIKQLSGNYFVVNINNHIDAGILEQYLIEELQAHGLNLDFEYGIYDCANDQMVYGDFCSIAEKEYRNKDLGVLPKYEEFIYYFGVKFPSKSAFIVENVKLAIAFSIISLLAIFFFVYSVFIILKQKKLSELQKDFINNMTHEFKTPISSIKLASETLLKTSEVSGNHKLNQYTQLIRDQNQRLNDQIEKFLSLAKMETLDLHELIHGIIQPTRIRIQKLAGSVDLNLKADSTRIQADKLHLVNVLTNLIDNAIKYTKQNPHVEISTRNERGKLICTIKDQGIGISEENIKKVFAKFYRVPTGNVHDVKGFGLGLFYVKNVCDAHGWHLKVESEIGKGTSMIITI